jgi:site-specific DNA-methyltransferase (adenine-specific)
MTLTLHHGDCLELMKTLPDKSIDLFVCDLPYGCLTGGAGKEKEKRKEAYERKRFVNGVDTGTTLTSGTLGGCVWDIPIDLTAFWVEIKRLCKNDHTPVLMFCTAKFGFELMKSNEDWFRYDLVWSKGHGTGFLMANKMPMRSHEMVYVFSKKGANYTRVDIQGDFKPSHSKGNQETVGSRAFNGGERLPNTPSADNSKTRCVLSVVSLNNPNLRKKASHPTQKPDDLYEWLITRYSKEGDTILDPTAGSFASCFTAQRLGRNAIGIEKDGVFYEKAVEKTNPSGS